MYIFRYIVCSFDKFKPGGNFRKYNIKQQESNQQNSFAYLVELIVSATYRQNELGGFWVLWLSIDIFTSSKKYEKINSYE
jgi:hypothetical protein